VTAPAPELVHCFRYVEEDGVLVDRGFSYMAAPCTIWDEELIAWAREREAKVKR
jgi:hypothetical protein